MGEKDGQWVTEAGGPSKDMGVNEETQKEGQMVPLGFKQKGRGLQMKRKIQCKLWGKDNQGVTEAEEASRDLGSQKKNDQHQLMGTKIRHS